MDNNQTNQMTFPRTLNVNLLPETIKLIQDADGAAVAVITIDSPEAYQTAADQIQKIKGLSKHIEESRRTITKPIDDLKSDVMGYFKPYTEKLTSAETSIKRAMIAYDNEQERLRMLAAAKAEEDARKEREKLEAKAEKLEAQGKTEQAEAVAAIAASTVGVAPAVAVAPVKTAGISKTTTYSAEVKNSRDLIKSVAAQFFLMECMGDPAKLLEAVKAAALSNTPALAIIPDEKFLNAQAKALKDSFEGMYPGVKLVKTAGMSARAKTPF